MTVVVRLIVDGAGKVADARVIENAGGAPAFGEAVLVAVRGWTFFPLKRVTGRVVEPLPFTQDYRFVFRQVNGRAVVELGGLLYVMECNPRRNVTILPLTRFEKQYLKVEYYQ